MITFLLGSFSMNITTDIHKTDQLTTSLLIYISSNAIQAHSVIQISLLFIQRDVSTEFFPNFFAINFPNRFPPGACHWSKFIDCHLWLFPL